MTLYMHLPQHPSQYSAEGVGVGRTWQGDTLCPYTWPSWAGGRDSLSQGVGGKMVGQWPSMAPWAMVRHSTGVVGLMLGSLDYWRVCGPSVSLGMGGLWLDGGLSSPIPLWALPRQKGFPLWACLWLECAPRGLPPAQNWHLPLGSIALVALWWCGSLPALAGRLYGIVMTLHLESAITHYFLILQFAVVRLFLNLIFGWFYFFMIL